MSKLPVTIRSEQLKIPFTNPAQTLENERGWLDVTGTAVSWICLIHCVALPFFISLVPLIGLSFLLDERVEWLIIGASVLVGAVSLLPAYFRRHGKTRSLLLFLAGIGLVVAAHLQFEDNLLLQIPFLLAGAGLITAAHLVNRHLCRTCTVCVDSAKQHKT